MPYHYSLGKRGTTFRWLAETARSISTTPFYFRRLAGRRDEHPGALGGSSASSECRAASVMGQQSE